MRRRVVLLILVILTTLATQIQVSIDRSPLYPTGLEFRLNSGYGIEIMPDAILRTYNSPTCEWYTLTNWWEKGKAPKEVQRYGKHSWTTILTSWRSKHAQIDQSKDGPLISLDYGGQSFSDCSPIFPSHR